MDTFTLEHLQAWVADNYPDRPNVEFDIRDFVADFPDVIERGLGWTDILVLAERELGVSAARKCAWRPTA